jgi:uncharacterized membrane protein
MNDDSLRRLPPHIEEAVQAIARLHADHHKTATAIQRSLGRATSLVAEPWFVGLLTAGIAGWMAFNLLAVHLGYRAVDEPPFAWLGVALSLASLYMMILVYASQRREYQLYALREQLTLELALLSEQKSAKLIQLLEEFRRDIPLVHNRFDPQAAAMAEPADPVRVVEAIRETHRDTG